MFSSLNLLGCESDGSQKSVTAANCRNEGKKCSRGVEPYFFLWKKPYETFYLDANVVEYKWHNEVWWNTIQKTTELES
jgi:hypothetical protein